MSSILICDPDASVRSTVRAHLEALTYDVLEADSGAACRLLLQQHSVDIVIADENMPDQSGAQLVRSIKEQHPWVAVIISSSRPGVGAAVECLKTGAIDYVVKPISREDLERAVQEALMESQALHARHLSDGHVSLLDTRHRMVAGYEIVRTIGEGGCGTVFQVRKPGEDQGYAMKVLRKLGETHEEVLDHLERFLHEAEAIASVNHPNVIRILDFGVTDVYDWTMDFQQIAYLVMEYLEGDTLKSYITGNRPLGVAEKCMVVRQLADALATVHRAGVCHRDIKPENVLMNDDLVPKLTDFGIAHTPDSHITVTSDTMGSPAYMAPESFETARVDSRADIFSLGTLTYELLLGRRPFLGLNIAQLAHRIQFGRPVAPRRLDPAFPPDLEAVLAKMLQKNPGQRYQTALEVVDALGPVIERLLRHEAGATLTPQVAGVWLD